MYMRRFNLCKVVGDLSPGHTWPIFFLIVHDRDKISNREQSETNRNDENAMCDHLSEYMRLCFRLYEDSSRPFLITGVY